MKATLATLWLGERLGPLERACLRSFLRAGHPVTFYAYEDVVGIPEGVTVADAEEVLPRTVRERNAALPKSVFADYFRYQMQALSLGTWIDADVYCIKPFDFADDYVFGWENRRYINQAVLRMPADSPLTAALLDIFESRTMARWIPLRKRLPNLLKRRRQPVAPDELPVGWTGPKALTWCARRFRLTGRAYPREVFYPIYCQERDAMAEPGGHHRVPEARNACRPPLEQLARAAQREAGTARQLHCAPPGRGRALTRQSGRLVLAPRRP